MSNLGLGWPDRVSAATVSGGSWQATLPVTNVADRRVTRVARSTSAAAANTVIDIDCGATKSMRGFGLFNHNLQSTAQWRIKATLDTGIANLLLYSEQIDQATWNKSGVLAFGAGSVADATTAPDGETSADKLIEDSSVGAAHYVMQGVTKAASAIQYTVSVYAKPAGRNWLQIAVYDASAAGSRVWFNLATGAVGTTAAIGGGFTGVSAAITAATNGFYRCSITFTTSTTTTLQTFLYCASADNTITYTGDGASGLYLWGAQLVAGAAVGLYCTTTSASASITLVATSGWRNALQMSTYADLLTWTDTGWWEGMGDGWLRNMNPIIYVHSGQISARWVRFEILDTTNPDGYVQVGRAIVAPLLVPATNDDLGRGRGFLDFNAFDTGEAGAEFARLGRKLKTESVSLSWLTEQEARFLRGISRQRGTDDDVLYVSDVSDAAAQQEYGFLARIESGLESIDQPLPGDVRRVRLKLRERT